MLPESEPLRVDRISSDEDFSRSKDERDFPKYRNIRFDFCVADSEMPESDGEGARVKLSKCDLFSSDFVGLFLCLISDVRTTSITTAKVVPVPIAISSKSPCDSPSIDTLGTESRNSIKTLHVINCHLPHSK